MAGLVLGAVLFTARPQGLNQGVGLAAPRAGFMMAGAPAGGSSADPLAPVTRIDPMGAAAGGMPGSAVGRRVPEAKIGTNLIRADLSSAGVPRGELEPVGRIQPFLSLAVDSARGGAAALTTARDGTLRVYAYPSFLRRSTHPLLGAAKAPSSSRQVAYLTNLDAQKGLLYAACSAPETLHLGPLGERLRARGDLHVYDVRDILAGKLQGGSPLRPLWSVPLDGHVFSLQRTSDGKDVYLLVASQRSTTFVGRVNTETRSLDCWVSLRSGGTGLALRPDDSELYLSAPGRVVTLDRKTCATRDVLSCPGGGGILVASRSGLLFLVERGQGNEVTVLNMPNREVVGLWRAKLPGRLDLAYDPDRPGRLYLSNSAVTGNQVWSVRVDDEHLAHPEIVGVAASEGDAMLRGESFLSPDGLYLVNAMGRIFRLKRDG